MDLMDMMSKMGELQNKMQESKKKLDSIIVEEEFEGIKVSATASKRITDINLPDALLQQNDKEQLQDLILAAINKTLEKAEGIAEKEAASVGNDFLPGGLGSLFGG